MLPLCRFMQEITMYTGMGLHEECDPSPSHPQDCLLSYALMQSARFYACTTYSVLRTLGAKTLAEQATRPKRQGFRKICSLWATITLVLLNLE